MKPASSRVRKWKRWLDKIVIDVGRLRTFVEIRRDYLLVIQQSPVKKVRDAFWTYIGFAMLDELVIRAVKLCDTQFRNPAMRVYSLRALLDECLKYDDYFSRRRYVGRKNPPPYDPFLNIVEGPQPVPPIEVYRMRNHDFDSVVGTGIDQLSKAAIQKDIDNLDTAIKKLKIFRNKFIAHNDFRRYSRKAPKYEEIPKSIEVITELTKKYYLLINRGGIAIESYVFRTDITRLFDRAWIETDEAKTELRKQFKEARKAT